MKLSEQTIEILKNYATLNPALQFKAGSVLATITPTKTVFATSRVVESFPSSSPCINDLNRFLAKISLYKECEIEFKEDRIVFASVDGRHSDYMKYHSPKALSLPPEDKKVSLDNPEQEFELSAEDLQWQRKSAGISGAEHIVFRGDGKKIYLQSTSLKDDSSDLSSTEVGKTKDKFHYVIKLENWKMLDGSYHVKLSKGLAKFEHTEKPLEYYVAIESTLSEF